MNRVAGRTTAWFNCHAGVAGDMLLGALVDAGADADEVARMLGGLGVDGYALMFERVQRCGVGATWANVVVHDDRHEHTDRHDHGAEERHDHEHDRSDTDHTGDHRPVRDVLALLDGADLPDRVRTRARAVFVAIAEAEGAIHGVDPLDVELHEVGALDSIVDIVGVCAALETLGVDEVWCSPIAVGHGTIRTAHGRLPNPAPATASLLAAAGAPIRGLDTDLEVATPTGVALMTTLASGFGAMPALDSTAVGYGAGTADTPDRANVVQVVVGAAAEPGGADGAPIDLVEVNVDDTTGEVLAHTVTQLLAAGAHDAWITPIVMKKGRPAHTVSALCAPARTGAVRDVLVHETGSLGVRATPVRRWPQRRTDTHVVVDGHRIGVKRGDHRVKVEFDDAAAAAEALGIPARIVIERAVAAADSSD